MKFGHFDDSAREYVIETPQTPYPWINYLGTGEFRSLISNTAGGYCFYKDARLRRIIRYRYNNVPLDNGGRYFYIKDGDTVWNPGWKPTKTELDSYECRHGMGYTVITGSKNDVTAEVLFMVPVSDNCEIQRVKISNNSKSSKSLKLFSFVEFCFYNAVSDMENFQRNFSVGEVEIKGSTIYHKTEYRERRNHYSFYHVNSEVAGFDTQREEFIGMYNGFENPQVVTEGKSRNSEAHGWGIVGSHCLEVELKPGETKDYVFVLGYVENKPKEKWESKKVINKKKAEEMIVKYSSSGDVDTALEELNEYWDNLLSKFQIDSDDEKLDRMVNIWNQYQCMITFLMSRSASYFESGVGRGFGFRDSNQDLLGFVHLVPERARERILDLAATQLEDGGAYHQYQPLTKKGNDEIGGNFNDDPMWLVAGVDAYIRETGDWDILEEQVPFDNDESKAKSLFDHLTASFSHVVNNLGPHDLPLIGRADWNDCLNLNCFSENPDESFQTSENKSGGKAESLMIAGMFVLYGRAYIEICRRTNREKEADTAQKEVDKMVRSIEKHGWDGEWFLRAYDFFGDKVGSNENEEGNIFIESQGFCTMAGIGLDEGLVEKSLDSVKKLLDCEQGIVLNQPAYTEYQTKLGEISSYPEGYKENASVFCHNNPWIMIGETVAGNGDRAFEYFAKTCPSYLEDISEIHVTEPYVYSQMIAGKDAVKPGEAKNSWLTGSAAWNYVAITQYILGVRPGYDGLIVDPCIPKSMKGFKATRKFRGSTYEIEVKNPDGVSKGVKEITVDGEKIEGNEIPVMEDSKTHKVTVTMGG